MDNYHILIIDDDEILTDMLNEYLTEEGYQIDTVSDGLKGLRMAQSERYAMIILDVMLPSLNGKEVLKRLRQDYQIPVLMLTARGDDLDRILGLELGADDYLAKPFNTRELVARIKAILRRSNSQSLNSTWRIGNLHVDTKNWQVHYEKKLVELTTTEFQVLNTLYQSLGKAVNRSTLTEEALGRLMHDFERAIDTHVSNLRRKLKELNVSEINIKSVRGIGYTMIRKS